MSTPHHCDKMIKTIAPWFGCARMLAEEVGRLVGKCRWIGVPFAGGMPELLYLDAPTIVVSDLHRHVINLARCLADERIGPILYRRLRRMPFHPEVLADAQEWLKVHELPGRMPDRDAAERYFVGCWMGRSGKSGGVDEFNGSIPVRWNANGGDSATRYRSAVRSLVAWRRIMQRCTFVTMDCFEFLGAVQDEPGHAVYCDPPFFGPGDKYKHKFTEADHRHLAVELSALSKARVVVRYYDIPLVRELYPLSRWTWHEFTGRKQSNAEAQEVLIVNDKNGRLF